MPVTPVPALPDHTPPATVFRDATVLTMDAGRQILPHTDVLIVDDSIAAIGPHLVVPTAPSRSTPPAAS